MALSTERTLFSKDKIDFLKAMIRRRIWSDGLFTVSSSRTLKIGFIRLKCLEKQKS
jgi:hypothetical protein